MEVNNRFVEEYAKEYFCDGERAKVVQEKKCRLLRSSRYPEKEIERILSEGIKNAEDVVHILAWKTGKIIAFYIMRLRNTKEKRSRKQLSGGSAPKNPNKGDFAP